MWVCSTDCLYHYLLGEPAAAASILRTGLLPLSAMPDSARWREIEAARPGVFEQLYGLFAEPILRQPYRNSGVFLTPIDFRRLPETHLALAARFAVPVAALPLDRAALTYELDGRRHVLPVTPEHLEHAAAQWTAERVREWFGRDRSRMFFFVPQVAVYPESGIPVRPEWLEPSA